MCDAPSSWAFNEMQAVHGASPPPPSSCTTVTTPSATDSLVKALSSPSPLFFSSSAAVDLPPPPPPLPQPPLFSEAPQASALSSLSVVPRLLWCVLQQIPTTVIVYAYLGWLELLAVLLLNVATALRCLEGLLAAAAAGVGNEKVTRSSINVGSLLLCAACFAYLTLATALPWEAALQFTAVVFVHCDHHQRKWTASHPSRLPAALELTVYICGLLAVCPSLHADHNPLHKPINARQYDMFCCWFFHLALFLKVREIVIVFVLHPLIDAAQTKGARFGLTGDEMDFSDSQPLAGSGRFSECCFLPCRADIVRCLAACVSSLTLVWLLRYGLQSRSFSSSAAQFAGVWLVSPRQAVAMVLLKLSSSEFLSLFNFGENTKGATTSRPRRSTVEQVLIWVWRCLPIVWSLFIVWKSVDQERHSSSGLATATHPSAVKHFSYGLSVLVALFSVGCWLLQERIVALLRSPEKHELA